VSSPPATRSGGPAQPGGWERAWRRARGLAGQQGSSRRPAAFLLLAVVVASAITPTFTRIANLNQVLVNSSFLVVLAVGEAFVIMVGSIDLGLESLLASFGLLAGWLTVLHSVPTGLALIVTLLGALIVGAVVGLLVAKVHIPSFVVTLGTFWGFRGVALLVNGGEYISPSSVTPPHPFGFEGLAGNTLGLSNLIWVSLLVVVVGQLVMTLTPFGLWLKSIGSNELAARRVGLRADALKVSVFVISAGLAALAGLMITAYQGSIYPLTGQGYSLEAIAAVILGGIPFTGGRGTVVGAALGALLVGVINDLIVLIGLPALYEYVFVAVVLVAAGLQARGGALTK
jgi:ribose/xylose/arabinose/galactoside ABC-type transport system permease subunit